MRCSVVIPVHNRASLTRQCLETIFEDPRFRDQAEVVVVDDGSSDETADVLAAFGDTIRVVTHPSATGFAQACNDGAAAGAGDVLVFLNNDTMPVRGWLDALLAYAEAHPDAAVVGAKLLFPDDTIQHAGMTIGEDLNPRHIYAGFPADHPAVNRSRRVPAVTAACALFRREPFEEAGGFDDAFRNGFEDVDLCLRLAERGHEIHYCHESVAYHLEMGTRDFRDELTNLALYRRRWAHKVEPDAMSRYVEDGLLRPEYGVRYPFSLYVSPLLAVVEDEWRRRETERELAARADHVAQLLRENVQLRRLAAEAGLEPPRVTLGLPKAENPSSPRAALFASAEYGDAMRYRCDHPAEELELLGATSDARWLHALPLDHVVDAYGCFVLHRVPGNEHVLAFVEEARHRGKAVVYDTDELDFDPDGDLDQRLRANALAAADAVFVATAPLAERAGSLNEHVYVVPSAASREMVRLADEALERREAAHDEIRLVYGGDGRRRDFADAAGAVLWALETYGEVRLLLVGDVDLGARFDRYADRVRRVPAQPWRRIPSLLAGAEINLAPSERGNPVADARPCREWLEAALVATPTIASPRPDVARVVRPGSNGFIADGEDEWRAALGELIESRERRQAVGRAARDDARRSHTTDATARVLYDALVRVAGEKARPRKLTVNVLVGSDNGAADARRLSRLAAQLGWRGHRVRLFASSVPHEVRASVDLREPRAPLPPADATIATDAETARIAAADSHSLFTFLLGGDPVSDELHVHRLSSEPRLDADAFEELLLDRCFARLDPTWEEPEADE